jgi:hypothetical protein
MIVNIFGEVFRETRCDMARDIAATRRKQHRPVLRTRFFFAG